MSFKRKSKQNIETAHDHFLPDSCLLVTLSSVIK